jgi:hypothetical protein
MVTRVTNLFFIIQFSKSSIGWPEQPPREWVSDISKKNWTFDDPFHKKGPFLVILVPGMIQPSGLVILLMK